MNGHIISELRYKHGLSQEDLSKILKVSKGAVAMWETNKRYPSTVNLIELAKLFKVSTDYLLGLSIDSSYNPSIDNEHINNRISNMLYAFKQLNDDNQDIIIGETKKILKSQNIDSFISSPKRKKA